MTSKLLGGSLLLAGTAMGGGLLALPLTTATTGFINAFLLMAVCWALMTATALLTVEASLWFPPESNIISMTDQLLPKWVTYLAWISYLLLFYSITAAYIASGASFLSHIGANLINITGLQPSATIVFTVILGSIIYQGIHCVDHLNRWFMVAKLVLYTGLVSLILPHSTPAYWYEGNVRQVLQGFSVVITAFSYTNMIPSLRTYFGKDIKGLKQAIMIGSTVPLLCYTIWMVAIMGIIPLEGQSGLIQLSQMNSAVTVLIDTLNDKIKYPIFPILSNSFSYMCILTTSLTCSFGLSDFLADGFKLSKGQSWSTDAIIYGATLIPPLLIALLFPSIFITALQYAGIYCLILFGLIPIMLVWRGRYQLQYTVYPILRSDKKILCILATMIGAGLFYSIYQVIL